MRPPEAGGQALLDHPAGLHVYSRYFIHKWLESPFSMIRVSTWPEFLTVVSGFDQWAFRGEARADQPLLASLARRLTAYCPDRSVWPLRERRAIRIFRRKAHVHVGDGAVLDDDLRVLAMMQHHGGATRLLDFTKSPFVAAFFALEHSMGESVVYALNTPALWTRTCGHDSRLTRDAIDPRIAGHYDRYFVDNRFPVVWFGEPADMDRRLIAQSGLFVVPGILDVPLEELLGQYSQDDESLLVRIVLDPAIRAAAMRELYRMNITYATLWPDLDGLARSINQELETVWQPLLNDPHNTKEIP